MIYGVSLFLFFIFACCKRISSDIAGHLIWGWTIIAAALKMLGVIYCTWFEVFSPLLAGLTAIVVLLEILGAYVFFSKYYGDEEDDDGDDQ